MASSGSYARGDQPRSVPDPDQELHQKAAQKQRTYNEAQEAAITARRAEADRQSKLLGDRMFGAVEPRRSIKVGHPGKLESFAPVWGPGREAIADAQDGDVLGAIGTGVLAATDVVPAKAVATAVTKGAFKFGGPHVWRTKPWEKAQGVRQWMGEKGHLRPGEHGHHWAVPQGGWGKGFPDWFKNQPWDILGLEPVKHGRIHGPYTFDGVRLPRFTFPERLWHGAPDWFKAGSVSVGGRVVPGRGQDKKQGR